ncbi:MAG: hypothetical protein GY869_18605 [Planctomycetes bacterium]|nr:hypothetical protein [Planctomycetota bacterium]
MELIATVSYPSSNPISFGSVMAVVVCLGLGFWVWKSKLSKVSVVVGLVLPLVISGLSWGTMVYVLCWGHSKLSPDFCDWLTGYIYLGFGFGCSLAAVRKGRRWVRYSGAAFMLLYVVFIGMEIIDRLDIDVGYRISKLIDSI